MVSFNEVFSILRGSIVSIAVPEIAKGTVSRMATELKLDARMVSQWVQSNTKLWDNIPDDYKSLLVEFSKDFRDLDWLTAEWMIDALKNSHPAISSLFLSWKRARTWLDKQIVIIKAELTNTS